MKLTHPRLMERKSPMIHRCNLPSYNLKIDFVAPNSLGHTSNYLPLWSWSRSTFYIEKPPVVSLRIYGYVLPSALRRSD